MLTSLLANDYNVATKVRTLIAGKSSSSRTLHDALDGIAHTNRREEQQSTPSVSFLELAAPCYYYRFYADERNSDDVITDPL